jgi:hypothetical protein
MTSCQRWSWEPRPAQGDEHHRELLHGDPSYGREYLGLVHGKRDERRAAADCYRRMLELVRRHPEDYEPAFEQQFEDLIAKLDPKATA